MFAIFYGFVGVLAAYIFCGLPFKVAEPAEKAAEGNFSLVLVVVYFVVFFSIICWTNLISSSTRKRR